MSLVTEIHISQSLHLNKSEDRELLTRRGWNADYKWSHIPLAAGGQGQGEAMDHCVDEG